jgi:hypothetical protein
MNDPTWLQRMLNKRTATTMIGGLECCQQGWCCPWMKKCLGVHGEGNGEIVQNQPEAAVQE